MAKTRVERIGKRIDRDPEVQDIEERIEAALANDPALLDLVLFEYRTVLVAKAVELTR